MAQFLIFVYALIIFLFSFPADASSLRRMTFIKPFFIFPSLSCT